MTLQNNGLYRWISNYPCDPCPNELAQLIIELSELLKQRDQSNRALILQCGIISESLLSNIFINKFSENINSLNSQQVFNKLQGHKILPKDIIARVRSIKDVRNLYSHMNSPDNSLRDCQRSLLDLTELLHWYSKQQGLEYPNFKHKSEFRWQIYFVGISIFILAFAGFLQLDSNPVKPQKDFKFWYTSTLKRLEQIQSRIRSLSSKSNSSQNRLQLQSLERIDQYYRSQLADPYLAFKAVDTKRNRLTKHIIRLQNYLEPMTFHKILDMIEMLDFTQVRFSLESILNDQSISNDLRGHAAYLIGTTHELDFDLENAFRYHSRALTLSQTSPPILFAMAELESQVEYDTKAEEYFKKGFYWIARNFENPAIEYLNEMSGFALHLIGSGQCQQADKWLIDSALNVSQAYHNKSLEWLWFKSLKSYSTIACGDPVTGEKELSQNYANMQQFKGPESDAYRFYISIGVLFANLKLERWDIAKHWLLKAKNSNSHLVVFNPVIKDIFDLYEAEIALETGDFKLAKSILQARFKSFQSRYGPDHLKSISSTNNLAQVYENQGKPEKALQLYKSTNDKLLKLYPTRIDDRVVVLNNLAMCLSSLEKYNQAEQHLLQALEIGQKQLGPLHDDIINVKSNLFQVYTLSGQLKKGFEYSLKNFQDIFEEFGSDHPASIRLADNVGFSLEMQGKLKDALTIYKKLRGPFENTYGATSHDYQSNEQSICRIQGGLKRYKEFLKCSRLIFEWHRDWQGETHRATISAKSSFARALIMTRNPELGLKIAIEASNEAIKYIGKNSLEGKSTTQFVESICKVSKSTQCKDF
jgi:hypothetical protein